MDEPTRTSTVHIFFLVTVIIFCSATGQSDSYTSPQFTSIPTNATVAADGTATFQCGANGDPPPSITWYGKAGEVVNGDRFSISSTTGELTVTGVSGSDAGEYYCEASNAVGSVRSLSASLDIAVFETQGLPAEDVDITTLSVSRRQRLILNCTIPPSLPPPTFEWEHNGATVVSSNQLGTTLSGKLVISTVVNDGRFYCYAHNEVIDQRVYTSGYLLIFDANTLPLSLPTQFVTTPTSQSVLVGDSAHFECFTTGTPAAEIAWTKDGSPLSSSSSSHISFSQTQRVLTVGPVSSADAGSYACVATVPSTESVVTSSSATLTVIVPPTIMSSFSSLAANATVEVELTCEVTASEDVQWIWRVNSTQITSDNSRRYDSTGLVSRLVIDSVMEEHGGVYQCVATMNLPGGGGQRRAAANNLLSVILTPPTLLTQPTSDVLVFTDGSVSLPCTASGFPPPTFSWVKGEGVAVDISKSHISQSEETGDGTLTISPAELGDSSLYQCTATNSAGSVTSSTAQLRVIEPSTVIRRPEDLAVDSPSDIYTADYGSPITIPCQVDRPEDDGTTVDYKWYRNGQLVDIPEDEEQLIIANATKSDRGRYSCVAVIKVSGVGGQPLEEDIGSVTIGVGEQPTQPSIPSQPSVSMVTSNTLRLSWTPPTNNGNLPLEGYSVEVRLLGNYLCPPLAEGPMWVEQQRVDEPNVRETVVTDLIPYQKYQVRIRARNSVYFSDPAMVDETVETLQAAPSAPPSNVEILSGDQTLDVSWQHPSNCLTYGGTITDYTVSYRISSESTFEDKMVLSNKTSLLLTSLRSQTSYIVLVSARTAEGAGPQSDPVEATTNECSIAVLTNLRAQQLNNTAALVSWTTPTDPNDLYIITWCHGDAMLQNVVVRGEENSTIISRIAEEGKECVVTVNVNNRCGTGEANDVIITSPGSSTVTEATPLVDQTWFIAVIAVVGTLSVCGIPTVVIFIICFCFKRHHHEGKFIPRRRSPSSLSAGSNSFTEYHQKHSGIAKATRQTIHSDPPPLKRGTDYADFSSYNSHVSSGSPSIGSGYQRQTTTETNGIPPSFPDEIMEGMAGHITQSPTEPVLYRPPSSEDSLPMGASASSNAGSRSRRHHRQRHRHRAPIQDDSTDSEGQVYPGHMTSHMTDGGGGNRDWIARQPLNDLAPLHEHQVVDNHVRQMSVGGSAAVISGHGVGAQHTSQPMLNRNHSPSPPPVPTSLPPPLSLPPAHTRSMDQLVDHHLRVAGAPGQTGMSHPHSQFQTPGMGLGIQNGMSQPVLSTAGGTSSGGGVLQRPPSPEYAELNHVTKNRNRGGKSSSSHLEQQPKVPPKLRSKGGTRVKPLSSAPNLHTQIPMQSLADTQPKVVAPPIAPPTHNLAPPHSIIHAQSFQDPAPPPVAFARASSQPNTRATSQLDTQHQMQATPNVPVVQRPTEDLKGLLNQWKSEQEKQERDKMTNGYPNVLGLLDIPEGLAVESSTAPSTVPSSRPSVCSTAPDRWTPSPQLQPPPPSSSTLQQHHLHILTSETPIVKNAPHVFPQHQPLPTTSNHHSRNLPAKLKTPPLVTAPRSSRTNNSNKHLEDIYQCDPRKPKRRKGRVPGAVWKQMPMSNRIESSSSDSESSLDSDNASLTSEYV